MNESIRVNIVNFGPDTLNSNDTILIVSEINSDLMNATHVLKERLIPGDPLHYVFPSSYDLSVPGTYRMKIYSVFRNDLNHVNDTLKYILESFDRPELELGSDVIVQVPEYVLSAPSGYQGYLWQDGSASPTFTVNRPGRWQYFVTVTDQHMCTNSDSVNVTLNVTDVALTRIISPSTGCSSSDSLTVSVRLKNSGNIPLLSGQKIRLNYTINTGAAIQDSLILPVNFIPGDSTDFVFRRKAVVMKGQWYNFRAVADLGADMISTNNSMVVPVGVFVSPVVNLGDDYKVVAATIRRSPTRPTSALPSSASGSSWRARCRRTRSSSTTSARTARSSGSG
jgi:hypothetical protein